MFQRILVPLDRSARSEHALPVAVRLARASGGTLILVEISNTHLEYGPYRDSGGGFAPLMLDRDDREVAEYLRTIARSPLLADIATESVVASGSVPTTILELAHTHSATVIVMVSRGRSGLVRWILGSMTQKVARHAATPVLVLSDGGPSPADIALGAIRPLRVLVPLDGSSLAEAALAPALQLVRSLVASNRAEVHLLRVVGAPASSSEATGKGPRLAADEVATFTAHAHFDEARAYLAKAADNLRNQVSGEACPLISYSVIASTDPAQAIIEVAEGVHEPHRASAEGPFDLIGLATHGRSALERWALGSVMERVLDGTRLPLFIIHAAHPIEQESSTQHRAPADTSPPFIFPLF